MTLQETLDRAVEEELAKCGGNRTHAAIALGISLRTLRRRLRRMAALGHNGTCGPNESTPRMVASDPK